MIDDKKLQKKLNFKPHEGQEKLIRSRSKLKVICAGRRFGKTMYAAYEATKKSLEDNQRIWIVAPDFSLTQIVFEEIIKNLVRILGEEGFKLTRKPHPRIALENGTIIECRSVENPKGMLGRSTDLVIMDEAAVVDREVWQQYIRPTTIDNKGNVIMISTPRGQNWFYDLWLEAGKGKFHFPSSMNKHVFNKKSWEELKESTPQRVFEQEYEAQFLSEAGSVFRGIDDIVGEYYREDPIEGRGYIMGVDLAKHEDYTVIIVMDRASLKVVHIDRFKDIDYNLQKERIIVTARKYNNAKAVIDATGQGDPIVQDLKQHLFVEDYRIYTNKAKEQLIDKLSIYIEQGLIEIPKHEVLIDELRRFGYIHNENSGITRYSAPRHRHDDCVIALALCVWGILGPQKEEQKTMRYQLHNQYL